MRPIITFAITCALMACVSVPVGAATAMDSTKPRHNTCKALAVKWGITTNDRRSAEQGSPEYERFMITCLASKVEGTDAQKSERWANCVRHRIAIEPNEYRSSDTWLRVIVSCL
jgi:hypothetical protein